MPQNASETFGHYARRCRKRAGVTLETLRRQLRIAPVEIQAIERDQAPPPAGALLDRWAEALGVDPAEFRARADRGRSTPTQ